jgi:lipid II:glycine glycyltransferase (peptidoglycan interpeptide bridge formation enzyme)
MVFCEIRSFLTGSRLVSLPFSDHCQPLIGDPKDLPELLEYLQSTRAAQRWKYIELRPTSAVECGLESRLKESEAFYLHRLDLRPNAEDILQSFHKSCVRRKLQRADREGLSLEQGRSKKLLRDFYSLLVLTRRRHQVPPQPFGWFENLSECLGDKLSVRVALKEGRAIASILTLSYKETVTYKYGCSDPQFHNLGGMPFLFWGAIQDAKQKGAEEFDFGRSDLNNEGLISFKDNWGTTRTKLTYYRFPDPSLHKRSAPLVQSARKFLSMLPNACLTTAGKLLYRHIG